MAGNFDLLNFRATDLVPLPPESGKTDQETISNLLDYSRKLNIALLDVLNLMSSKSSLGFTSMTDGTKTVNSSDTSLLTLSNSGDTSVTLDADTGTLTFITTTFSGTLDDITEGTTYKKVLSTDISAGHILLSETTGTLDDVTDGTTYQKVLSTDISAGRIILASSGDTLQSRFDGVGDLAVAAQTATITNSNVTINADGTLNYNGAAATPPNLGNIAGDVIWDSTGTVETGSHVKVPKRFVDAIPTSGSGLLASNEALGYYKSGQKLTGTLSGAFTVGERVVQAVSGAKGIVSEVSGTAYITVLTSGTVFDTTNLVTGDNSGKTMTPSTVTTATTFGSFISSAGNFYFAGDGDNYISWDGVVYTARFTKGFIGNTTDYFDITNSLIHLENASAAQSVLETSNGTLKLFGAGGGTAPSNTAILLELDTTFNEARLSMKQTTTGGNAFKPILNVESTSGFGFVNSSCDDTSSGRGRFAVSNSGNNNYIKHNHGGSGLYEIKGYTLTSCSIAASQINSGTMDASRISGGTAGAFIGNNITSLSAPNILIGDINTARMQTNAIAAVNLSTGTITANMNAANLSTGTIPDARFPIDSVGMATGTYAGSASNQTIDLGVGNAALHVIIKRSENTGHSGTEAVWDGTNLKNWLQVSGAAATNDTPISQASNGFTVLGGDAEVNIATKNFTWVAYYKIV